MIYPVHMLFQFAQDYSNYGTYPDGKPKLEQSELLLAEMDTVQSLIAWKKHELDPNKDKRKKKTNGYQLLDQDVLLEFPSDIQAEMMGERFLSMENM